LYPFWQFTTLQPGGNMNIESTVLAQSIDLKSQEPNCEE